MQYELLKVAKLNIQIRILLSQEYTITVKQDQIQATVRWRRRYSKSQCIANSSGIKSHGKCQNCFFPSSLIGYFITEMQLCKSSVQVQCTPEIKIFSYFRLFLSLHQIMFIVGYPFFVRFIVVYFRCKVYEENFDYVTSKFKQLDYLINEKLQFLSRIKNIQNYTNTCLAFGLQIVNKLLGPYCKEK